jgi:hypothetical protein
MGMVYNWFFKLTMPLRDLRWKLSVLRGQLLQQLFYPKKMKNMLLGDMRRIVGETGSRLRSNRPSPPKPAPAPAPAKQPPKKQPPAKPPPRRR